MVDEPQNRLDEIGCCLGHVSIVVRKTAMRTEAERLYSPFASTILLSTARHLRNHLAPTERARMACHGCTP